MTIERLLTLPHVLRAGMVLCAALAASPAHAAKPSIGTTSLVVQQVEGTSEQNTRQLALRDPVYQDEVVVTGFESASEMLLMDDTRVTVGPSSRVVLDRFVYDPDPGKGALVLQATEGVFRFFSGSMASSNYVIEAPSVTVGIRGTIFVGATRPSDKTFVLILESRNSEISVTARSGETVVLNAPGQAAIALPDGTLTPGPVPDWAAAMVERMDGIVLMAGGPDPDPGSDKEPEVATTPGPAPAQPAGNSDNDRRSSTLDGGSGTGSDGGSGGGGEGNGGGSDDDGNGDDDDDGDGHGKGNGHKDGDGHGKSGEHGKGSGHKDGDGHGKGGGRGKSGRD